MGQPERAKLIQNGNPEPHVCLIFPTQDGIHDYTQVDFSSEIGILTVEEIKEKKKELFVVKFKEGLYLLFDDITLSSIQHYK